MFDIRVESDGRVSLSGRFDAAQVEKADAVFAKLEKSTVVDLEKLEYISSAGLSTIIVTFKRLRSMGQSLKLTNASKHVRDIFRYSMLDQVIDIG